MDTIDENFFLSLVEDGKTYDEISQILQENNPGVRGFSVRSVKRYCQRRGISTRIPQHSVEQMVRSAVREVKLLYL